MPSAKIKKWSVGKGLGSGEGRVEMAVIRQKFGGAI